MSSFFYYLGTSLEAVLSVFGVRGTYEQPHYRLAGHIGDTVEIRAYDARMAVQTPIGQENDSAAFGRLFRYITGENRGGRHIAMTIPVEQAPPPHDGQAVANSMAADMTGETVMRFFLPARLAQGGPPAPTDPAVHIVTLPPQTVAVLRFSGMAGPPARTAHIQALLDAVRGAGDTPLAAPSLLFYDPPFALPFLRRNEVSVPIAPPAGGSAAGSAP